MFQEALKRSIPPFLSAISNSTPDNSSPYLATEQDFVDALSNRVNRQQLLHQLQRAWRRAEQEVELCCTLIGGSFLDFSIESPKDVDAILFYSAPKERLFHPEGLAALQNEMRENQVDARLVPVDSAPLIAIKLTSYFTTLYMSQRGTSARSSHGLVLVAHQATAQVSAQNE